MPEYEYLCRHCGKSFNLLLSLREHDTERATCPVCKKADQVEQQVSLANVKTSNKTL